MDTPCQAVRDAIETRRFIGWRGLPRQCRAELLFDVATESLDSRPQRRLGDDMRSARFILLSLPGYYRPTASFRDGELILFDGRTPDLEGGFDALRDDLGTPAAELDWDYGTLPFPGGEWPYPDRGVTIFLNSARDRILHIALYTPTTLEDYRSSLRPHLRKEHRPAHP